MAAILLEGRPIADKLKRVIAADVAAIRAKSSRRPKLVAVQIGENVSSSVYARNQRKTAEEIGIDYELKMLSHGTSQAQAETIIRTLDSDKSVSAIILQMPVPDGIDAGRLMGAISPEKDAEGMHPQNIGKVLLGGYSIGPCTAMAVMAILESTGIDFYAKEAVVVGHSEIVGKPIALMLLNKFATTTVCHIATGERGVLPEHVKSAEILVVSVGKAGIVKGDWIRPGAIVVDVGINRVLGKITGDVEFEAARGRASFITPVPGGVGALTTMMLMKNTVELFKAKPQ